MVLLHTPKFWDGLLLSSSCLKWGCECLLDNRSPPTSLVIDGPPFSTVGSFGHFFKGSSWMRWRMAWGQSTGKTYRSSASSQLIPCWFWCSECQVCAVQSAASVSGPEAGWASCVVALTVWDDSALRGLRKWNIKVTLKRRVNHSNSEGHNIYMLLKSPEF